MNLGLTKRQLLNRGWTHSQIRQFFPEPSQRGPYGQPLYAVEHVEQIEASPEFQAVLSAKRARANSARRSSAVRRERALASVVEIQVPILDCEVLIARACEHYNSRKSSRHPDASWRSEPEFLHRICVNYLRHELTSYHEGLQAVGGRAGDQRALAALRAQFLSAIAAAYQCCARCEEAKSRRSDFVDVFIPERRKASLGQRTVYRRYP
jgi:hypothetical protein